MSYNFLALMPILDKYSDTLRHLLVNLGATTLEEEGPDSLDDDARMLKRYCWTHGIEVRSDPFAQADPIPDEYLGNRR